MRLCLFVAIVRIVMIEVQITSKSGDIEWEAIYSISSPVPSASTETTLLLRKR
jgi:hypothetical protein